MLPFLYHCIFALKQFLHGCRLRARQQFELQCFHFLVRLKVFARVIEIMRSSQINQNSIGFEIVALCQSASEHLSHATI